MRSRKRQSLRQARRIPLHFDLGLLLIFILLLVVGIVMVYEASVVEASTQFGDKTHFAMLQLKWALIGSSAFLVGLATPLTTLKKITPGLLISTLVLLLLVLIPGVGTKAQGATRWLNFGPINIQPSEIVKLTLVLYLAALFEKAPKTKPFIITIAAIVFLVMLQPDMGTTIVITATAFVVFYLAGAPLNHLVLIAGTSLTSVIALILFSPYRRDRLFTFLDPNHDPLGSSYHIRQVIIALGSGGLTGTGLGRSLQKYSFLPEATTDSIFAVIAEELGFIGGSVIIAIFVVLALKGLNLAASIKDRYPALLAAGLTCLITLQAFLNLAAMTALVPLTGITLPLISYGGSSLVITMAAAGLLFKLSNQRGRK